MENDVDKVQNLRAVILMLEKLVDIYGYETEVRIFGETLVGEVSFSIEDLKPDGKPSFIIVS
jgi:hypothetical protein